MIDADTLIHQRFRNSRPGLSLVAIEDGALPVTIIGTEVLAQECKPLPLLHEFVLRYADLGVHQKGEISHFLGVDTLLVDAAIAEQVSADNLRYSATSTSVHLTTRGKNTVRDLESIVPIRVQMPVSFDRLTWNPSDYPRNQLMTKREAQDAGMIILPALKTVRITQDDLRVTDLNALLRVREGKILRREILAVQRIRPHTHRYLPVKILVYGEVEGDEVELGLVIEGDSSTRHNKILEELGGAAALGMSISEAPSRPVLDEDLEARRLPFDEVMSLRSASLDGRLAAAEVDAAAISDPSPTTSEEVSLANVSVRAVSVFEHRELLIEALEQTTSRLLIISPWVKSSVVDDIFIQRLARLLDRGVKVTIAHGIGKDDEGSHTATIARLRRLSEKYEKLFTFARLANTHAKVLIFDDHWISTSFNWLSFRGDPDRTYRMEEGTLVKIPGQVTTQYYAYLELIEQQRVDKK